MNGLKRMVAAAALALTSTLAGGVGAQAQPQERAQERAQEQTAYRCVYYVVRRGDTLNKIAAWYRSTVGNIQFANRLRSWVIYPGQRLCIPYFLPPPSPPVVQNPWFAEYWNNTDLSGSPSFTARANEIDFNWGFGTPSTAYVLADNFSARYTRVMNITGGRWRMSVTHDDGARMWINNVLVLDQWGYEGPAKISTVELDIPGPNTSFRLEYLERTGMARLGLGAQYLGPAWGYTPTPLPTYGPTATPTATPTPGPTATPTATPGLGGWIGDFFNNRDVAGAPTWSARYHQVNFDWGYSSPNTSLIVSDNFSARFVARPYFAAGNYRLVARSDDGVRVYVDGVLQIDAWRTQGATTYTRDITLAAGDHDIKVEYFDASELASLVFYWEPR